MTIINELSSKVSKFNYESSNYKELLDLVGDAEFVLIGESTHGTQEFYEIRAELTKRLIEEKSFDAIAIEGDWPDTYNINKYVRSNSNTVMKNSLDSLSGFQRFPTWMWRNKIVLDFIDWLHNYNKDLSDNKKIGFYGLDLYSLNKSIEVVISYLDKIDKAAANRARERYGCFNNFKEELSKYGYASALGITPSCENAVTEQLLELNSSAFKYLQTEALTEDELFYIEQNARSIKNAEQYYRTMYNHDISSWNIRDDHMTDTLYILSNYIRQTKSTSGKIVVWAHNSHIGDARASDKSQRHGEINLGQRVRERSNDKAILIGFITDSGTVTAASNWGGHAERKNLRPSLKGSYEHYFKYLKKDFILDLKNQDIKPLVPEIMLERAVGVIYRPQTEFASHYFYTNLSKQFDALIYLNKTKALTPLEYTALWHKGEEYETFPFGT